MKKSKSSKALTHQTLSQGTALDSSLTMDGTRWESFSRRSKPLLEMSNEFEYGKEIEKFLNNMRHA